MKMEQTECSETSAYKIQMPGNYPEENIQHTEQGESLKSRRIHKFPALLLTLCISLITVLHERSHTMESVEKQFLSQTKVYMNHFKVHTF